jgi:hypothetical protein
MPRAHSGTSGDKITACGLLDAKKKTQKVIRVLQMLWIAKVSLDPFGMQNNPDGAVVRLWKMPAGQRSKGV